METSTVLSYNPVAFSEFKSVEPSDLTSFTPAYLDHIPELRKYLVSSFNKAPIRLLLKRIEGNSFIEKIVTGTVVSLSENQFVFKTKEDLNNQYEHTTSIVIRTDSVLGVIPLLPSAKDISIATISPDFKRYLRVVAQMRQLLISCEGTEKIVRIDYRFDKNNLVKRNGNYHVLCQIKKVNKSNIEYLQLRASAYINDDQRIVELGAHDKIARFISPDCYISSVQIFADESYQFNFHDDEDFPN
jgi:hypothetical protein